VDAALEQIASTLGIASVDALLHSIGDNGLDLVERIKHELGQESGGGRVASGGSIMSRMSSASEGNDNDDNDDDEEESVHVPEPDDVRPQDLTSRREALDGLDTWPPPATPYPIGRSTSPGGTDQLIEEATTVVRENETEIRRIAQLGRPDTSAWHSLCFDGGRDAEIAHVLSRLIPSWGLLGGAIWAPIKAFLEGGRDEEELIAGLVLGAA
jgi:hypothetical protein